MTSGVKRDDIPTSRRGQLAERLRDETTGGVLLIIAAIVAIVWANSPFASSFLINSLLANSIVLSLFEREEVIPKMTILIVILNNCFSKSTILIFRKNKKTHPKYLNKFLI